MPNSNRIGLLVCGELGGRHGLFDLLIHAGGDQAGGDAVDPDTTGGELKGEGAHEAVEAGFAGPVGGVARGTVTGDGTDKDEGGTVLDLGGAKEMTDEEGRGGQVDLDDLGEHDGIGFG